MESKSPKRTREVVPEQETTKRKKGEAGQPVPTPAVAQIPARTVITPLVPLPERENQSTNVERAFLRSLEGKQRVKEGGRTDEGAFTLEGMRKALEEVELRSNFDRDVSEQYANERRRQSEMRNTAAGLEMRINILENALKDVHTTSQSRITEQKLRLESLEAERSASLKVAKREVDQLQSHIEIYKRICGVELTAVDNGYRAKVKFQHNEIIAQLTPVSHTELEVELKSYTVPAERIEADLKEPIVIDPKDAPVLLHHLYQCLV